MPSSPNDAPRSPVSSQIRRELLLGGSELGDRLRNLVGPLADTPDLLLGSRAAFATALAHLADLVPPDNSA